MCERMRLRGRFAEGTVAASADFLLEVDPTGVEHQVNVNLQPHVPDTCWSEAEAERAKTQQCQVELERERKRPDGLTGAERQRVVVAAEATETQARDRFTLSLWQDGEPPSVAVDGVRFP